VLVCTLAGVLMLMVWATGLSGSVPRGSGTVTFPAQHASIPPRIVDATDSPPGRAVAVAGYANVRLLGDLTGGREVLIGADRATYRTVPSHTLLGADGLHAFMPGGHGRLTALDLVAGTQRHYQVPGDGNTAAMALSHDGRLAVVGSVPHLDAGGAALDDVRLLDLRTGRSRSLTEDVAFSAAFSPDGTQIALARPGHTTVVDHGGQLLGNIPTPAHASLRTDDAWSPDGHWLALDTDPGTVFVPALAAVPGQAVPPVLPDSHFLGWTANDRFVVFEEGELRVKNLQGGWIDTLGSLSSEGGELIDDLAGGILDGARTGAGSPDFGPLAIGIGVPPPLLAIGGLALLAPLVVALYRRARRRPSQAR
jgi:hypothetical protein